MVVECLGNHTLPHIEHITSPINNDQNRTKTCRIARETNAEVKSRLPCVVFVVVSNDIDIELARSEAAFAAPSDAMPVVRADVHGTFIDRSSAVERAREVAQEMADGVADGRVVQRNAPSDVYEAAFAVHGYDDCLPVVYVKRDNGEAS